MAKGRLMSTAAAAETLGISVSQFDRIVKAAGILPDDEYTNPNYKSGPPARLWSTKTVGALKRRKAVQQARERKGGHAPKEYTAEFRKRYASPRAALTDACEAMFNLNRYTRHKTCSRPNRQEILELKAHLITHLYKAEVFTDRVERLTRTMPKQECFRCDATGYDQRTGDECERCFGTGNWQEEREVSSYVFRFTVDGQQFTWVQPDHALTFEPRVEETKPDPGRDGPLDDALNIQRSKLAEAKALVRFALEAEPDVG